MNPIIREATRADLLAFYEEDRIGPSFRAIVGIVDDKIIAVGGLAYKAGLVIAFCDLKPEARAYKHRLHRSAVRILNEAKRQHKYIYAEQNDEEPTARRWLERLNFRQVEGNIWIWPGSHKSD